QQLRRDGGERQGGGAEFQLLIRNDVGGGSDIAHFMVIILGHVVDHAFVQRPGVHLPLPLIHRWIAEAEHFALGIGDARSDPRGASFFELLYAGGRQQLLYLFLQVFGLKKGIVKGGVSNGGVGPRHIGGIEGGRLGRTCCEKAGQDDKRTNGIHDEASLL